jgi:hypothetical protein
MVMKEKLQNIYKGLSLFHETNQETAILGKPSDHYVEPDIEVVIDGKSYILTADKIFDLFSSNSHSVKILISGESGIGKNALRKVAIHKWSNGLLLPDKYLLPIDLKLLLNWHSDSNRLSDFIFYCINQDIENDEDNTITRDEVDSLIQNNKQDIILMVANYHDVFHLLNKREFSRIFKAILDFPKVLMTARDNSLDQLIENKFDYKMTIKFFDLIKSQEYVTRYFNSQKQVLLSVIQEKNIGIQDLLNLLKRSDNNVDRVILTLLKKIASNNENFLRMEAIKATDYIEEYYADILKNLHSLIKKPEVVDLVSIPINLSMLCLVCSDIKICNKFNKRASMYDLYKEVVLLLGKKFIADQGQNLKFSSITNDMVRNSLELKALRKIAYESFINGAKIDSNKVIEIAQSFKQNDPNFNDEHLYKIGVLKKEVIEHEGNDEILYSFIHSSFQEYFTARFLIDAITSDDRLLIQQVLQVIANNRNDSRYLNVLKFLTGMVTDNPNSDVVSYFWEAILCNVYDKIELGYTKKILLMMHLLPQATLDGFTFDQRIPDLDRMITLVDDFILNNLWSWSKEIKTSGYISQNIISGVFEILEKVNIEISNNYAEESSSPDAFAKKRNSLVVNDSPTDKSSDQVLIAKSPSWQLLTNSIDLTPSEKMIIILNMLDNWLEKLDQKDLYDRLVTILNNVNCDNEVLLKTVDLMYKILQLNPSFIGKEIEKGLSIFLQLWINYKSDSAYKLFSSAEYQEYILDDIITISLQQNDNEKQNMLVSLIIESIKAKHDLKSISKKLSITACGLEIIIKILYQLIADQIYDLSEVQSSLDYLLETQELSSKFISSVDKLLSHGSLTLNQDSSLFNYIVQESLNDIENSNVVLLLKYANDAHVERVLQGLYNLIDGENAIKVIKSINIIFNYSHKVDNEFVNKLIAKLDDITLPDAKEYIVNIIFNAVVNNLSIVNMPQVIKTLENYNAFTEIAKIVVAKNDKELMEQVLQEYITSLSEKKIPIEAMNIITSSDMVVGSIQVSDIISLLNYARSYPELVLPISNIIKKNYSPDYLDDIIYVVGEVLDYLCYDNNDYLYEAINNLSQIEDQKLKQSIFSILVTKIENMVKDGEVVNDAIFQLVSSFSGTALTGDLNKLRLLSLDVIDESLFQSNKILVQAINSISDYSNMNNLWSFLESRLLNNQDTQILEIIAATIESHKIKPNFSSNMIALLNQKILDKDGEDKSTAAYILLVHFSYNMDRVKDLNHNSVNVLIQSTLTRDIDSRVMQVIITMVSLNSKISRKSLVTILKFLEKQHNPNDYYQQIVSNLSVSTILKTINDDISYNMRNILLELISNKIEQETSWSNNLIHILSVMKKLDLTDNIAKKLSANAKRHACQLVEEADDDKIQWVTNNFDELLKKFKDDATYFMEMLYEHALADRMISEQEREFFIKCIKNGFTTIISNVNAVGEGEFDLTFNDRTYHLKGIKNSERKDDLIKAASLSKSQSQKDDLFVFPNTKGMLKKAAIDIKNCYSLLNNSDEKYLLTADKWIASFLYLSDHQQSIFQDAIILFESRTSLGDYAVHLLKVNIIFGYVVETIYLTSHPDDINLKLRQSIFGEMPYTENNSKKTRYFGSSLTIDNSQLEKFFDSLNTATAADSEVIIKERIFSDAGSEYNNDIESEGLNSETKDNIGDERISDLDPGHIISLLLQIVDMDNLTGKSGDMESMIEYGRKELLKDMQRSESIDIDRQAVNLFMNKMQELDFRVLENLVNTEKKKLATKREIEAILNNKDESLIYEYIQRHLNSVYLASTVISTNMVNNEEQGNLGVIGSLLGQAGEFTPLIGPGVKLIGSVLVGVDQQLQFHKIENFARFSTNSQEMAKISEKLARNIIIALRNKEIEVPENNGNNFEAMLSNVNDAVEGGLAKIIDDAYINIKDAIEKKSGEKEDSSNPNSDVLNYAMRFLLPKEDDNALLEKKVENIAKYIINIICEGQILSVKKKERVESIIRSIKKEYILNKNVDRTLTESVSDKCHDSKCCIIASCNYIEQPQIFRTRDHDVVVLKVNSDNYLFLDFLQKIKDKYGIDKMREMELLLADSEVFEVLIDELRHGNVDNLLNVFFNEQSYSSIERNIEIFKDIIAAEIDANRALGLWKIFDGVKSSKLYEQSHKLIEYLVNLWEKLYDAIGNELLYQIYYETLQDLMDNIAKLRNVPAFPPRYPGGGPDGDDFSFGGSGDGNDGSINSTNNLIGVNLFYANYSFINNIED